MKELKGQGAYKQGEADTKLLSHVTCKLQTAVCVLNFAINVILISILSAPRFSLQGSANVFALDLVWNQENLFIL